MEEAKRRFRDALGLYATGVVVVTTVDKSQNDRPTGMTVNSFTSLSLDPPLVLWNLGDHADCYGVFSGASHFCAHVLHQGQESVSRRFATKSDDKFAGIEWSPGLGGVPVLSDYAARFECATEAFYPGGDHLIIVGRVVNFEARASAEPLLFFLGKYRQLQSQ